MNRHRFLPALLAVALLDAAPALAQSAPDGKALFAKNCAACHQANGRGIPGAFPPLAGSPVALGAPEQAATVLLKGRGGMPAFSGSLDDAQIAGVLSYVRASWGNGAAGVSGAEVEALRSALNVPPAGRSRFGNKH